MARTIAFIGCGAMGAPMAERLIDGGFPVTIFDINKEAMRPSAAQSRGILRVKLRREPTPHSPACRRRKSAARWRSAPREL
jgi:3-hydroxyacyl-CoA dehydrogenase